jgi:hypothetical protein
MRSLALILPLALMSLPAHAQGPKILSRWVQLGPGGSAEVRAAVEGTACPQLTVDGHAVAMTVRAAASPEFAQVCAAPIADGAKSASIAAAALPLPVAAPERVLVLGDTGCRIKGSALQACNDPRQWPFPVLAAAAARLKPDLIIHLGDYLYRENACPAGDAGCAGTPFGDNWPTWNADFFAPAAPFLAVAPVVFVRGNHEDCQRAGFGWIRMLSPQAFDAAAPCADHIAPYAVPLGGFGLIVMDDANAPDTSVDASAVPVYQSEIGALSILTEPVWLVTHRPIWGAVSGPLGVPAGGNATLIAAVDKRAFPKAVKLMLAGHIHSFEAINYDGKAPPQIVAGNGGDNLDRTPADLKGTIFQGSSGVSVKDGLSVGGFGFLLMTKLKDRWTIDLYDADATYQRQCVFAAGRVDCPNPPN